jgi:hypothetical protein
MSYHCISPSALPHTRLRYVWHRCVWHRCVSLAQGVELVKHVQASDICDYEEEDTCHMRRRIHVI